MMRTKAKIVFYCEHCKKHGLVGWRIAKHEKHCTGNLDRECRMCAVMGEVQPTKAAMLEAIEFFKDTGDNCNDEEIVYAQRCVDQLLNSCPVCKFVCIRKVERNLVFPLFDFKAEGMAVLNEYNDRNY